MTRAQGNASPEARKGMRRKVLINRGWEAFRQLWENRRDAVDSFESIDHEIKIVFRSEQKEERNYESSCCVRETPAHRGLGRE